MSPRYYDYLFGKALSAREQELLNLFMAGHKPKQIAEMWVVSIKDIDSLRARLLSKLGARTVAQAVYLELTAKHKRQSEDAVSY